MDISEAIDTDVRTFDVSTTVSQLRGAFTDPGRKAVVITNDDSVSGVITRRDILSSHEQSSRKAGSLVRAVPTLEPDENVREAARLMLAGDTWVLPVNRGEELVGVLRADAILQLVKDHLSALEASDVMSQDVVAVRPSTSLGRTLATFREHSIRHLPVTDPETGDAVGIVSVHDVLDFVTRELQRSQGGRPDEGMGKSVGGHHGGFGAREGERDDLLELPIRDLMADPIVSVTADETLDKVLELMYEHDTSSVLVPETDGAHGIVTKTDILESLTWEDDAPYYIHVFGAHRMSETTWEHLSSRIEQLVRKDRTLGLLEAKVHFHHHKERLRGRPFVLARIRLFTDQGTFVGSGEGFGDRHAFSLALDVIERQILEAKDENHPSAADRFSPNFSPMDPT